MNVSWSDLNNVREVGDYPFRDGTINVTFAELGEAESRFDAGLLDGAGTEVDPREPAALRTRVCRNRCVRVAASHGKRLYPKTFRQVFMPS